MVDCAQVFVGDDPAAAGGLEGLGRLGDDVARLDARRPDDGARLVALDGVSLLELDVVLADARDAGSEHDLHAHLREPALHLVGELLRQDGHRAVEHVDVEHRHLVPVDLEFLAEQRHQLGQLARHLDAGEARADHIEGQQPAALGRVGLARGAAEDVEQVLAQDDRVVVGPQGIGDLLRARHAEEGRLGAGREDEIVVGVGAHAPFEHLAVKIDRGDRVKHHMYVASREDPFEADLDAVLIHAVCGDLVQLGVHGVEGVFVDDGDLHVLLFFQPFRQFFGGQDARVARADNDNVFQCFHLLNVNSASSLPA